MSALKATLIRVQARAVKRAKTLGLSPDNIECVKRSGEAAVAFARQTFRTGASKKRR